MYKLVRNNQMIVTRKATALNKPTTVNLAHHAFWNLGGNILHHEVQIFGSYVTPVASQYIPTGKVVPVTGIPYNFHLTSHHLKQDQETTERL